MIVKIKTDWMEMMDKRFLKTGRLIKFVLFMFGVMFIFGQGMKADAKQKFVVGFDASFPPYGYLSDDGEYVGFDLDLAAQVAKRNGWELVKQPIDWESKDTELKVGNIDCIWNGFTMNGRENQYTWSTPYIDNSQIVIVNKDSDIKKLSDLNGKIVCVQSDSSALAALKGNDATPENKKLAKSMKEITEVGDYNSAFMNLESGMVDAVCMDIGVASYKLEASGDKYKMLDERLSSEEYGIGFKKGNTKLRDKVQVTLLEMLQDGTFDTIVKKWKLEDSACLSLDDKTYIDGGKVPEVAKITPAPQKEDTNDAAVPGEKASNTKNKSFINIALQLSEGMGATLLIFVLTLVFSMPLGLPLTAMRMSRIKIVQWIAKIYISIMRGTPLMLQLLVVFYGPYYIFKIKLPYEYRFYAVIIGFALNYAAYFAEIYRSGIQSIPVGQREAAEVLGYSKAGTFFKIIFPQMIKRIMPPVTNEVITLVKDTSLAFAVAYTEMFKVAQHVSSSMASVMPLFVAGLFYYVFNFIVAYVMELIEKKFDYYR